MNESELKKEISTKGTAKIVYILYMVGLVFGISGIIGVVIAYIYKPESPEWLKSHYQFQIRTFWIGSLYLVIGVILSKIIIGWFVILFWAIWLIARCVKGMRSLDKEENHPDPMRWMF